MNIEEQDIRIVDGASIDSLDLVAIEKYIQLVKEDRPNPANLNNERLYKLLNITRNGIPTLAAVMVFSLHPQILLPKYTINTVSEEATFEAEGNIKQMLGDTLAFLSDKITQYPLIVVREVILNALMHRDFSIQSDEIPIQVTLIKDRLEVVNPVYLRQRFIGGPTTWNFTSALHPRTTEPSC